MTTAADPRRMDARVGMTGVLHSWGPASCRRHASGVTTHHPHIHMIVPGGGLSPNGTRWVPCRPGVRGLARPRRGHGPPSLLRVRVLSRLFIEGLLALRRAGALSFSGDLAGLAEAGASAARLAPFRKSEWVVIVPQARLRHGARPPFGGPEAVLAYLSRYRHRGAISNSRLVSADAAPVAFR